MSFVQKLRTAREEGRRVAVIGLGISGIETCAFLHRIGISTVGIEKTKEEDFFKKAKFNEKISELKKKNIPLFFGVDGESVAPHLDNVALAIMSPGISHESAIYGALNRRNILSYSELELGVELFRKPAVVVTGSNGKSTTVSLIHHLLCAGGLRSVLCGNVGIPVVSQLPEDCLEEHFEAAVDVLVVEASSYQLEACEVLKPKVGILLNLSDNHLERHGTMERYAEAKFRMFQCQDSSDWALLNADDVRAKGFGAHSKAQTAWVTINAPEKPLTGAVIDYHPEADRDDVRLTVEGQKETYSVKGSKLLGLHNRYNIAVSLFAARVMGVPSSTLAQALTSFEPLEHRLEVLPHQRLVINDSKSTTVASSVAAVRAARESYPDFKIVLLIGGLAKAGSWDPLLELLVKERNHLEQVICFGKDGRLLANHCEQHNLPVICEKTLSLATTKALSGADLKSFVLLSPGCASFDEFSDFEGRGHAFKQMVKDYLYRP